MSEPITRLVEDVAEGRPEALDRLIRAVYDELRAIARARVAREAPGATLRSSDLVHEAYLRLFGAEPPRFEHRRHFFAAAAETMRRILIDRHRERRTQKRGGDARRVPLDAIEAPPETRSLDIEALGLALDAFRAIDPRGHEIVQLRYFLGFSVEETAEALDLSPRTVKSDWAAARVWLKRRLSELEGPSGGDAAGAHPRA